MLERAHFYQNILSAVKFFTGSGHSQPVGRTVQYSFNFSTQKPLGELNLL